MSNARSFRILLFSGLVVALLLSGVCAAGGQARPLADSDLNLSITASQTSYAAVGEEILYTYILTNRSGYPMYGVSIVDDLIAVACPSSSIDGSMIGSQCHNSSSVQIIEGQMTCTGSHTITQADIDNGHVTNTASVGGNYDVPGGCGGPPLVYDVSADASLTISASQQPSISLTKTASPTSFLGIGELIAYTYTVENTGNVSLAGPIVIMDDMVAVSCPAGGLAPMDSLVCTASHTTTEVDLTTGAIRNSATATTSEGVSASDDFEVLLELSPGLSLEKYAYPTVYTEYWELLTYTYIVTNAGNVPVEGPFQVQDAMLDEWNCPETVSLGLGESLTCTGYYRTRNPLGDPITNCATVEGVYQTESVTTNEVCVQIPYAPPSSGAAPPVP